MISSVTGSSLPEQTARNDTSPVRRGPVQARQGFLGSWTCSRVTGGYHSVIGGPGGGQAVSLDAVRPGPTARRCRGGAWHQPIGPTSIELCAVAPIWRCVPGVYGFDFERARAARVAKTQRERRPLGWTGRSPTACADPQPWRSGQSASSSVSRRTLSPCRRMPGRLPRRVHG